MLLGNAGRADAPPALEITFLTEMSHAEDFVQQRFNGKPPTDQVQIADAYEDYVRIHDERGCRVRKRVHVHYKV
jgi:hypothetical protein